MSGGQLTMLNPDDRELRMQALADGPAGEERAALADALAMHSGFVKLEGKRLERARKYSHVGFKDAARISLAIDGERELPADEIYRRSISAAHLPYLLTEGLSTVLHEAYQSSPSTWLRISAERLVANFKEQHELKIAIGGALETLGPGGKIPLAYGTESAESYRLQSKGLRLALSFEQYVNDEVGAFMRLAGEMMTKAKRAIDDAGYDLLCSASGLGPTMGEDAHTLFYSSRATPNYYAHATDSSMNFAGLSQMRMLLAKMAGPDGTKLGLAPRFLLVPPELDVSARQWVGQGVLTYTTPTTGGASFQPTQNVFSGMAEVLSEPRLSEKTNGTTAWYGIADPLLAPALITAYLRGVGSRPKLDTYQMEGYDNMVWQVLHYVAVGVVDWRGVIRMKGAA